MILVRLVYIYILSHYLYYLILSGRCSTLNLLPICSSFRGMSVHSSEGKTETPTVLLHCQKNALWPIRNFLKAPLDFQKLDFCVVFAAAWGKPHKHKGEVHADLKALQKKWLKGTKPSKTIHQYLHSKDLCHVSHVLSTQPPFKLQHFIQC